MALDAGAAAHKHRSPSVRIAIAANKISHRWEINAVTGLGHRQDSGGLSAHITPRARGDGGRCGLRQWSCEFAGRGMTNQIATAPLRAGGATHSRGATSQWSLVIPNDCSQDVHAEVVGLNPECLEETGGLLVIRGHRELHCLATSKRERQPRRICGEAIVVARCGGKRHQLAHPLSQTKPSRDFDEPRSSSGGVGGSRDLLSQRVVCKVIAFQSQHQLWQDHRSPLRRIGTSLLRPAGQQVPNGGPHQAGVLEIKTANHRQGFRCLGGRHPDQVTEQRRRAATATPPDDLSPSRARPFAPHQFQPGSQSSFPELLSGKARRAVGSKAEGLSLPAITRGMTCGQHAPKPVRRRSLHTPQGDRSFPPHKWGRICRHLSHEAEDIPLDASAQPQRDRT